MDADGLATQEVSATAGIVVNKFDHNIPVTATDGLTLKISATRLSQFVQKECLTCNTRLFKFVCLKLCDEIVRVVQVHILKMLFTVENSI